MITVTCGKCTGVRIIISGYLRDFRNGLKNVGALKPYIPQDGRWYRLKPPYLCGVWRGKMV